MATRSPPLVPWLLTTRVAEEAAAFLAGADADVLAASAEDEVKRQRSK